MIRAGTPQEVSADSGEWLFVDVGFSSSGRSCGVLGADNVPVALTFSDASARIIGAGAVRARPLNLLIEAPLSVAFNASGNPVGRSFERQGAQHRYWYEGLGCLVTTSALYLLRALADSQPQREVRLFEGFVSFKPKGAVSSHCADVLALEAAVLAQNRDPNTIIPASEFAGDARCRVCSAFAVAGMDFGIPPVVRAMANGHLAVDGRWSDDDPRLSRRRRTNWK